MAVNLTKQFKGREYTPIHLIDEETSVATTPKESSKEIFPTKSSTSITLNRAMEDIIKGIQDADSVTKDKFISEFYREVKAQRKIIKANSICEELPWIIVGVISIIIFIVGLVLPQILDVVLAAVTNPSEEIVNFFKYAAAVFQPMLVLAGAIWTIASGLMIYRIRN